MKTTSHQAFTLIELLVVVTIIGILAGIVLPVYGNIQLAGKRTQSLSNMRQLGAAFLGYCGDNNGQLPTQGDSAPTWNGAAANTSNENTAWYNVLPRTYGGTKGAGDYANDPADFYAKGSLFYVPAAHYPANKLSAPLFAVAMCSKLFDATYNPDSSVVRLQNIQSPVLTCIFQESGLAGEKPIYTTQSSYNGQSRSFASRSITRYGASTILTFADGHAAALTGPDIVASSGKAFLPQIGPAGGKVYWTLNPTVDANQ